MVKDGWLAEIMKYILCVSLFLLNITSFTAEHIDYHIDYGDIPPMSLITTRITVSPPDVLKDRLERYGFSDLAKTTNIAEEIGGQRKTLITLFQQLEHIFKQYSADNVITKPQKVFIRCVVNDLAALEKLEIEGYLK